MNSAVAQSSSSARSVLTSVYNERLNQIFNNGYDANHDDMHGNAELLYAAVTYLLAAVQPDVADHIVQTYWPFELEYFKPSVIPQKMLTVAAAFVVAEIERINRLEDAQNDTAIVSSIID